MATADAMADSGLSIGQVAQRTGLSVHTLRLYERKGLLASEVRRDGSGRRVYSARDVEWLANCVKFRASGMPLTTISRLAQLVREGSGNEAERLTLLRDTLELINGKVASYEQHLAAGASGDPWQQQPQLAPTEHTPQLR
ncbi:MerR family transcriptional regulator [Micromonospora sp. NPDC047187]|uniref:MerR family transcriptional regulator n=1 Tax=Micromonospora sp. NPDC047187 TaxID=3155262 RepID=UPI0033D98D76